MMNHLNWIVAGLLDPATAAASQASDVKDRLPVTAELEDSDSSDADQSQGLARVVAPSPAEDEYCPKNCSIGDASSKKSWRCKKAQPGEINIILYGHHWEPINKDVDRGHIEHCPVKCNMRYRGWCDAEKADAAVINVLWASKTRPKKKPPGQRWVFHGGFETQYRKSGGKRAKDYVATLEGKIDWTMGFGPRTDFYNPNLWVLPSDHFGAERTYDKEALTRNWAANKTQFMLWIASNCNMATTRMAFWHKLEEHMPKKRVKVLGKCGEPFHCPFRKDDHPCSLNFFSKYKFYFAAENGQCEGWITEKLTKALKSGMVPVVFGPSRADYERLVPKDSFIHADDFDNDPKKLVDYLKQLDKDDDAYNRYFAWRSRGLTVFDTNFMYRQAFCQLCQQLHLPKEKQRPTMLDKNLGKWFYSDGPYKRGACGWVDGPEADR